MICRVIYKRKKQTECVGGERLENKKTGRGQKCQKEHFIFDPGDKRQGVTGIY